MTLFTTKKILYSTLLVCLLNTPRYRRGASLVRVGPILLALGGRRRARSYNSVEVVTTLEMIVTNDHDVSGKKSLFLTFRCSTQDPQRLNGRYFLKTPID